MIRKNIQRRMFISFIAKEQFTLGAAFLLQSCPSSKDPETEK